MGEELKGLTTDICMWFLTDEEIEEINSGSFGLAKPEEDDD